MKRRPDTASERQAGKEIGKLSGLIAQGAADRDRRVQVCFGNPDLLGLCGSLPLRTPHIGTTREQLSWHADGDVDGCRGDRAGAQSLFE